MAFDILRFVARAKDKKPMKCSMRKCRNWQTSKTKDLVSIALVWVQVPSSAFDFEKPFVMKVSFFMP